MNWRYIVIAIELIIIYLLLVRSNKIEGYEDDCLKNPNEKDYDYILKWWEDFCKEHNLNYSLAYGTMLGYKRNKNYIPWDLDMDTYIGKKDAEKLIELEKTIPNIFLNNMKRKNKDEIFIVLTNDHNTNLDPSISSIHSQKERGRFNCEGNPVNDQIDNCSFNELFGRIVYNNVHCDLFVWFKSKDNQDKCSLCKGEYCTYNPTYLGSNLPETKKIKLNGVNTRILKDENLIESLFINKYGKDYMKPDHKCEKSKWKKV